ncbi:hypothetical protein D3C72_1856030 [compost metagenome]
MAADASFSTDTLSTSLGLIRSKPPARCGTPSITINGLVFPPGRELIPRTRIEEPSPPGSPLLCIAVTPGNLPAKELERLTDDDLARSSPFTVAIAPETTVFF